MNIRRALALIDLALEERTDRDFIRERARWGVLALQEKCLGLIIKIAIWQHSWQVYRTISRLGESS